MTILLKAFEITCFL